MVTHRVIAPTQATSADQLAAVPRQEVSKADSYQVVDVGEDYLVKVMVEGAPTRVRMLGVEPPLTASPEHPDGGVPKSALQFARNLLVGEFVCLLNDPGLEQRDADNNLVAYLYRAPDELLINLELIRQGYAVAAQAYSFEYRESFLAYQQKAQSDGKGIWGQLPTASP
jgi:micrococcal nuclease